MKVATNRVNMIGLQFGRLTVIEPERLSGKLLYWLCKCVCGTTKPILGSNLRTGKIRSCGCLRNEVSVQNGKNNVTHGLSRSPTYHSWEGMMQRCGNPKNYKFYIYGGRGITVTQRWRKFENFLADMGIRPEGLTLERKNNLEGYSASNCVWATRSAQNSNRRPYKWKRTRANFHKCFRSYAVT